MRIRPLCVRANIPLPPFARRTPIPFAAATWDRGFYLRQALGRRVGAEPRAPVRHSKPPVCRAPYINVW